jgi:hypothetical protein
MLVSPSTDSNWRQSHISGNETSHTREKISEIVEKLCNAVPTVGIFRDIVVGYPGETQGHFEETIQKDHNRGIFKDGCPGIFLKFGQFFVSRQTSIERQPVRRTLAAEQSTKRKEFHSTVVQIGQRICHLMQPSIDIKSTTIQ